MIVVAIIGILLAIAIPGFIKTRREARRRACQENLQKIDHSKIRWALDNNQPGSAVPLWSDIVEAQRQGYLNQVPFCPGKGDYVIGSADTLPTCSLGATEEHVLP